MKNFIKFLLVLTGYVILFTTVKVLDVYLGKPSSDHWYFYAMFYILPFGIYGWNINKVTRLVDVYPHKRQYKPLASLIKGDLIKIQFGNEISSAKVIANDVENQQIFLKVKIWVIPTISVVKSYTDYNFKSYDILNGKENE